MNVLVLLDNEDAIAGIWGPYLTEMAAQSALSELSDWPIIGTWEVVELKEFPSPQKQGFPYTGSGTYTLHNGPTCRTTTTNSLSPQLQTDFYGNPPSHD